MNRARAVLNYPTCATVFVIVISLVVRAALAAVMGFSIDETYDVVMARHPDDLEALRDQPSWRDLPAAPGSRVWTDDFSNIVSILRFE